MISISLCLHIYIDALVLLTHVYRQKLGSVEKVGVEPDPKRVGPTSWNLEHC